MYWLYLWTGFCYVYIYIYGPNRDEVARARSWRRLPVREFHNLNSSPDYIKVITSRSTWQAGHELNLKTTISLNGQVSERMRLRLLSTHFTNSLQNIDEGRRTTNLQQLRKATNSINEHNSKDRLVVTPLSMGSQVASCVSHCGQQIRTFF
jgi:hypothetical protein